jgi:hypothetical protein
MPEHIHLRISEPAKGTPSTSMQVLKRTCVAAAAAQTAYAYKTTQTSYPNFGSFIADVQAAALLRFKGVESEEVRRETSVYAYESGEEETCCSPQGLAMEQFFLLRETTFGAGSHRSPELILVTRFTSKAPAFKNRRLGHPKFQVKGRATRPGTV